MILVRKYYVNQQSLTAHGSTHDSSKNPHQCNVCSKAFPTEAQLRSHNPVHGEPMYICQYANCGRNTSGPKGKRNMSRSVSRILMPSLIMVVISVTGDIGTKGLLIDMWLKITQREW